MLKKLWLIVSIFLLNVTVVFATVTDYGLFTLELPDNWKERATPYMSESRASLKLEEVNKAASVNIAYGPINVSSIEVFVKNFTGTFKNFQVVEQTDSRVILLDTVSAVHTKAIVCFDIQQQFRAQYVISGDIEKGEALLTGLTPKDARFKP